MNVSCSPGLLGSLAAAECDHELNSCVWVTRSPAVTPATATSSMPSATVPVWATPARHDAPDRATPPADATDGVNVSLSLWNK